MDSGTEDHQAGKAPVRTAGWRRLARLSWLGLVLGFVAWQIAGIGLFRVVRAIPADPLFYLTYWAAFSVLPLSERLIFRRIWPGTATPRLAVFVHKRALNNVVLGYSGDIWFFWWARRRLGLPDRRILAGVKDSSLLSGLASALATAAMVAIFAAAGGGETLRLAMGDRQGAFIAAGVAIAVLLPVLFRFRRRILWVSGGAALAVFLIHAGRIALTQGLQVLQWYIALPQVPMATWLLFLTVQMLVNQLPVVPNRDLLFLAIGVELTSRMGVDQSALAGMLVAVTLLKQLTNLGALALTSVIRHDDLATIPVPTGAERPSNTG